MTDRRSGHVERTILSELDGPPVDQECLVARLSEKHDLSDDQVLKSLRDLMWRGEIHYNLWWDLTI